MRNPAARVGPYRLIQKIFVADIAIGAGIYLFAARIDGADAPLIQALEIVGLGLAAAGGIGFLMFAALARGARKSP